MDLEPIPQDLQQLIMTGNLMSAHLRHLCDGDPDPDRIERRLSEVWEKRVQRYIEERTGKRS